jgi:transcriptional regulator with XRE-family HTH domain
MSMASRMLRDARSGAGLTQRELAAKTGIPQETIARIERGRVDPRVGTLDRLLEGCGLGLEVETRLGIGIDRTQIRDLLGLNMGERLALAFVNDESYAAMRGTMRWVAE